MKRHRLIELRGRRSQESVAAYLKITRQMLSAIETGERTPSLELAKRISSFYGVPVDELFSDPECNESRHSEIETA